MKKIVIAGPPRSGKSCTREGLKQAIRAIPGAPYPYIITACPDGEGSWFQGTVNADPALAAACKKAYKAKFTPAFVARLSDYVRDCSEPLTMVDIGGIPSAENRQICACATHIMVLMPTDMAPDKFRELQHAYQICGLTVPQNLGEVKTSWLKFARVLGLAVTADIISDYHGTEDKVEGTAQDGGFRGSVHYLERGEPTQERPMVRALAEHIVALCK